MSEAALRAATGWLCDAYPKAPGAGAPVTPLPVVAPCPPAPRPAGPAESLVRFGARPSDVGILAIPSGPARRPARPAIVILNRFGGTARGQVEMARRWAGAGFRVFRFDPVGVASRFLGDEPGDPEATARAALGALARRFGLERFVVVGLCGGADLAFRLAGACERVVGALLVNPATLGLDVAGARPSDFAGQVRAMGARGVRAYVVCSERDPGLELLRAAVARHFAESGLPRTFQLETVAEGVGHVFAATASQRRLHDLLTRWIETSFP